MNQPVYSDRRCTGCQMPLRTRTGYRSNCSTHAAFCLCCLFLLVLNVRIDTQKNIISNHSNYFNILFFFKSLVSGPVHRLCTVWIRAVNHISTVRLAVRWFEMLRFLLLQKEIGWKHKLWIHLK